MQVCRQLRRELPERAAGVKLRARETIVEQAASDFFCRFQGDVFLNTDLIRDAKDVVSLLEAACSGGRGWKGPTALQFSSEFEAARFRGLGNGGAKLFVDRALPHLRVLRALDLGYNSLGPEGAAALAQGFANATGLTALSLRINLLGDTGVAAIARCLHHLAALEHLDLSNNWLQGAGARSLADGLRQSGRLKTLDLSKNNLQVRCRVNIKYGKRE